MAPVEKACIDHLDHSARNSRNACANVARLWDCAVAGALAIKEIRREEVVMKRGVTPKNAEIIGTIRLLGIVVIMASLSGSAAFALDPMGPPRAGVNEGQFSFGADLSYGETDLKLTGGKWTNPNTDPSAGTLLDRTIKDFETVKLYATAGYGFAENWEAFLGIGATKAEFGDDLWNSGEDFDSGTGLGIRGGVKATIFDFPDLDLQLGAIVQLNWANYDGKLVTSQQVGPDFVDLDLIEMQIAVGATYLWEDGLTVYAGPFLHYFRGDLEQLDVGGFDNPWDIDEGPIWGIYLGALLDLTENYVVNIEYQQSSDANVLSAGLLFRY